MRDAVFSSASDKVYPVTGLPVSEDACVGNRGRLGVPSVFSWELPRPFLFQSFFGLARIILHLPCNLVKTEVKYRLEMM